MIHYNDLKLSIEGLKYLQAFAEEEGLTDKTFEEVYDAYCEEYLFNVEIVLLCQW